MKHHIAPRTASLTILTEIAEKHLQIETLETRNRDGLDFHDVSVWGIRDALEAAFAAGRAAVELERLGSRK